MPSNLSETLSSRQKSLIASKSFAYWVQEFINLEHGAKFSFTEHPYLVQPYLETHPRIVEKKAAQQGLTTKAILKSIHGCINRFPLGVIYFFPSDSDVSDFSRGRAKPLISNNPEAIAKYTGDSESVGIRAIGKSLIYFRGMRSAVAVKSVPADMLVFDEYDEAPPERIEMARQRMAHSNFKEEIALSNPTIPGYGIDLEFQASDQNYWLIKCTKCNEHNNVVFDFEAVAGKTGDVPKCIAFRDKKAYLVCRKCGADLDRYNGQWVAKLPTNTEVRGYQYSQLISPFTDIHTLWNQYQSAILKGRLGTFYNLQLGLAYVSAKDKLTREQILELCDPAFPENPFGDGAGVAMGIDQGKDLHVVFKRRHKKKVLTWFVVEQDFEALDKYMDSIERCVIDAMPETRKAREFAERHLGKVYLNFYVASKKGITSWDEEQMIVQENRTESLDASHDLFLRKKNVLPARSEEVEEFADQCSAVAKKLETDEETGSARYIWVRLSSDHFRHADNYANIALVEITGGNDDDSGELNYV